jgi:hypothetical protein
MLFGDADLQTVGRSGKQCICGFTCNQECFFTDGIGKPLDQTNISGEARGLC